MIRMIQAHDSYNIRNKLHYMAGTVSDDDWQSELFQLLVKHQMPMGWDIMNPRPDKKSKDLRKDVKWQYEGQVFCHMISFWFPKSGDPSPTILELGRWTCYEKPLIVGVEKGFDLEKFITQNLSYTNKDLQIKHSLDELAQEIVREAKIYTSK